MVIDRSRLKSSFAFVVMAGARARQLQMGCIPRVEALNSKTVTVAQKEVLSGAVARLEEEAASEPVE